MIIIVMMLLPGQTTGHGTVFSSEFLFFLAGCSSFSWSPFLHRKGDLASLITWGAEFHNFAAFLLKLSYIPGYNGVCDIHILFVNQTSIGLVVRENFKVFLSCLKKKFRFFCLLVPYPNSESMVRCLSDRGTKPFYCPNTLPATAQRLPMTKFNLMIFIQTGRMGMVWPVDKHLR